jgi:hypothetical protein
LAVRVLQQEQIASVIDINVPSQIEIEFEVLKDIRALLSMTQVDNAMGICLFSNCDWRSNRLTMGRYRKHVELPGQLLAEGRFDVTIMLQLSSASFFSVLLPKAIAVNAIDSDHPLSVRGHYKGPWAGVIRIALPWSDTLRRFPGKTLLC